jgi:hypothetical protein
MSDRPGDIFTDPGAPWAGRTVFCLASGDSLRRLSPEQWAGIAAMQRGGAVVYSVNSSYKTALAGGVTSDAIFFTDMNWFEANEAFVRSFPGRVFCVSRRARTACDKVERLDNVTRHDFARRPPMRDGRSSGHRAVSSAIMMGAARVVMLGYDMRVDPVSGRSHCHDDYQHTEGRTAYEREFIPSFNGWHRDALAVGCEVVDCTDGGMLTEFPKVALDDLLRIFGALS